MIDLDVKDRRLLYYLSQDGRTPHTKLARLVGLSKNAVGYRIARLKERGIITRFATVVHLGPIGLTTFALLLRFNEDIVEERDVVEYFEQHPYTNWVVTLSGKWDLLVEIICKDLDHIHETIHEIKDRFGERLHQYETMFSFNPIKVEHLIGALYEDLGVEPLPVPRRKQIRFRLNDRDARILRAISEDSARPHLQLARDLGLTIDIVRYRVRKLIDAGILLKAFPEVSLEKLGYTQYVGRLELKDVTPDGLSSLRTIIRDDPNITYAFLDTLSQQIVFVCAFKDPAGIDALLRSLRKRFRGTLANEEYLIIREQIKFDLFPTGLVP